MKERKSAGMLVIGKEVKKNTKEENSDTKHLDDALLLYHLSSYGVGMGARF